MDFGMIIDLETTGLEPSRDEIIEIGILMFGVVADEKPFIVGTYGALNAPNTQAISPEVSKITGIYPHQVLGAKIDWPFVEQSIRKCSLVVAHNAPFDRSFLLRQGEVARAVEEAHWACSLRHIEWAAKGFRSRSLQHLAADHGFLNPFPHRAIFDCATTFNLIQPYFSELVALSEEPLMRLYAWQTPFEKKDLLKARGYKWSGAKRVWYFDVFSHGLADEQDFLVKEIYGGLPKYSEEKVNIWESSDPSPPE